MTVCGAANFRRAAFIVCDPLPTGQLKQEKKAEIGPDWRAEERGKQASTARSPLGRIALRLLFSTKHVWGVGLWLKDAGRGLQSGDPVIG